MGYIYIYIVYVPEDRGICIGLGICGIKIFYILYIYRLRRYTE